uniref:TRPM SLOG domain-containing protein n=1 Tax=Sinocyclocheilus grahami TaxID=75366 RepID=A0A672SJH6_SINGR
MHQSHAVNSLKWFYSMTLLFLTAFTMAVSVHPAEIYQMLTKQWGLAPPHLVVALMGGDEVAQMKPWLRDTLRKGLVKAAQSTGAWIFTSGLRFGITKNLGQAVRDHSLASTSPKVRVVAIGVPPWNMIQNRDLLLAARVRTSC